MSGVPALLMPVEITHPTTFAPLSQHLSTGGTHEPVPNGVVGVEPYGDIELIEFAKGVLYADGRVDLCKMVTGSRNIGALVQALRSNTFAKHFLLGNNIIGPTGAEEISRFIFDFPHRFGTWYLAGNCIDTASFHKLVDAMATSPVITNIWLKRNPLQTAACTDIYRLITELPALRTLDLDQTELGDDGIASFFSWLSVSSNPIALRHIYLNATGLGPEACDAISHFLTNSTCRFEALYISNNPIGDSISLLAPGLRATTTLQRLSLQSCGPKDPGCIPPQIPHEPRLPRIPRHRPILRHPRPPRPLQLAHQRLRPSNQTPHRHHPAPIIQPLLPTPRPNRPQPPPRSHHFFPNPPRLQRETPRQKRQILR